MRARHGIGAWGKRVWNAVFSTTDTLERLQEIGVAESSGSGVTVSVGSAIRLAVVWACVRAIAEDVASLPIHVYRRTTKGGRSRVIDTTHPLYSILHDEANAPLGMTAMAFRDVMQSWALLYGNAYALIGRYARGAGISRLTPIHPSRVTVAIENDRKVFKVRDNAGEQQTYGLNDIFHLIGPSMSGDGMSGMSPIAAAREAIGMGLAAEKYGARFFANASRPAGFVENPNPMNPKQVEEFMEKWHAAYGGADNVGKTPLLYGGMTWKQMSIPPSDAQFIESRNFQALDIARMYRVPPSKIGIMDRATFNNVEQLSIDYVVGTIRPWLVRWEQEIKRVLFRPEERGEYLAEHVVDGLLRGDALTRHRTYQIGINTGYMSLNEVRDFENMNPFEGGDQHFIQGAMVPIDQAGKMGRDAGTRGRGDAGTGDTGTMTKPEADLTVDGDNKTV